MVTFVAYSVHDMTKPYVDPRVNLLDKVSVVLTVLLPSHCTEVLTPCAAPATYAFMLIGGSLDLPGNVCDWLHHAL